MGSLSLSDFVTSDPVVSCFQTVLAFLPGMVERKHGHVVAILPGAGLCQLSNKVPYATIKYAITGTDICFTQLYKRTRPTGISC
jgi:short-subunit dehydrogenase